jgi:hypothetical protein
LYDFIPGDPHVKPAAIVGGHNQLGKLRIVPLSLC